MSREEFSFYSYHKLLFLLLNTCKVIYIIWEVSRSFKVFSCKSILCFRLMFWTDWGVEGKIERAGMDGSQRKVRFPPWNIPLIFGGWNTLSEEMWQKTKICIKCNQFQVLYSHISCWQLVHLFARLSFHQELCGGPMAYPWIWSWRNSTG